MPIKTILVAVAFEDDGKRVADRAVQLANQHKAQLVGVHVVENLPTHDPELPPSVDAVALARMIKDRSARQLQGLLAAAERPAMTLVASGRAHDVIESMAAAHHADLLVIGPGVARNLREKVFGSTADRLVGCASCPVLVVRAEADAPYKHIAVGVDFSNQSRAAALWASRISPLAALELIHGVEIPLTFEQAMIEAGTSMAEIEQYREAKAAAARERMLAAYGVNGKFPRSTRARIVHGNPALVLLDASRRRAIDLVALGTQGSNMVARHLLGSVARSVLSEAKCDVLAIPASLA